ncbi:MAG: hypothetical protein GX951_04275 [Mollicutes bacterium]|nr:hypothetical protein [Mollicutes bacterium]
MKKRKFIIYSLLIIFIIHITSIDVKCLTDVTSKTICQQKSVLESLKVLSYTLLVLKIMVPIIIIFKGIKGIIVAITSSDDAIKPAVVEFIQRLIIGFLVLFVPDIINGFGNMINDYVDVKNDFTRCTNCLTNPKRCHEYIAEAKKAETTGSEEEASGASGGS